MAAGRVEAMAGGVVVDWAGNRGWGEDGGVGSVVAGRVAAAASAAGRVEAMVVALGVAWEGSLVEAMAGGVVADWMVAEMVAVAGMSEVVLAADRAAIKVVVKWAAATAVVARGGTWVERMGG